MTITTESARADLLARLAALQADRDMLCVQLHDAPRGEGMGDQSEAQISIARVDAQIRTVTERLASLHDTIESVSYLCENEDGKKITYVIVHPEMSDPAKGLVSPTSPIGRALSQSAAGDEISIKTPRGFIDINVLAIQAFA